MNDPVSPGMRTLAALAPALDFVRTQLDADALLDPELADTWRALDATGHMHRLIGYVDGLVTMPEFSIGDVRDVTAAIVAAGLMVLMQLDQEAGAGATAIAKPAEPKRIAPSRIITRIH